MKRIVIKYGPLTSEPALSIAPGDHAMKRAHMRDRLPTGAATLGGFVPKPVIYSPVIRIRKPHNWSNWLGSLFIRL